MRYLHWLLLLYTCSVLKTYLLAHIAVNMQIVLSQLVSFALALTVAFLYLPKYSLRSFPTTLSSYIDNPLFFLYSIMWELSLILTLFTTIVIVVIALLWYPQLYAWFANKAEWCLNLYCCLGLANKVMWVACILTLLFIRNGYPLLYFNLLIFLSPIVSKPLTTTSTRSYPTALPRLRLQIFNLLTLYFIRWTLSSLTLMFFFFQ